MWFSCTDCKIEKTSSLEKLVTNGIVEDKPLQQANLTESSQLWKILVRPSLYAFGDGSQQQELPLVWAREKQAEEK